MDHDKLQECYEFLDLSDVDDSERNHLTTALYSSDHNQQTSWVHDHENTAVEHVVSAVQNSWHDTPFGQPSHVQVPDIIPSTTNSSNERNLVMPRTLPPLAALPIYAFVKPSSIAQIQAIPTIFAPPTKILRGAVTETPIDIDFINDNQPRTAMSPHSTNPHHLSHQPGSSNQQHNMNNQQQHHHHQQHQQQQQQQQQHQHNQALYAQQQYLGQPGAQLGGAMYQMMSHVIPNAYVSNVTANTNVHGYMIQAIPQYMTATTPTFVHLTDANHSGQVHEHQQTVNQNVVNSSNMRGASRRGRGRGNGGHRREYTSRQQPPQQELVPSMMESQPLMAPGYTQYYTYPYSPFFPAQPTALGHPSGQHASSSSVYLPAGQLPMYPGQQMYAAYPSGLVYQTMFPHEYGVVLDDKSEENAQDGQQASGVIMQPMWHPHMGIDYQEHHQMEIAHPHQEDYIQHEIIEDINQNLIPVQQIPTNQLPPQTPQHQPQSQTPQHHHHILNPNVATFTSMKSQNQTEYVPTSNVIIQQHPQINSQTANNQHKQIISQTVSTGTVNEKSSNQQCYQNTMDKNVSVNINNNTNKDIQVPSSIVTNMNVKVPVVASVLKTNNLNNNSNSNLSSNLVNNNRVYSNNNNNFNNSNLSPKNNQNVPNSSIITNTVTNTSAVYVNNSKTEDIVNKLVKSTNEKMMIKSDRGNKPPAWNNINSSTTNTIKKTTATVAVSAVPSLNNKDVDVSKIPNTSVQQSLPSQPTAPFTSIVATTITSPISNVQIHRQKLSPPPFTNNPAVVKSSPPFVPKSALAPSITNSIETVKFVTTGANKKTEIHKSNNIILQSAPTSVSTTVIPQQLVVETSTTQKTVESKQVEALPQQKELNETSVATSVSSNEIKEKKIASPTITSPQPNSPILDIQNVKDSVVNPLPIQQASVASSSKNTWASLFSSGKPTNLNISTTVPDSGKKPIAKVFPFETTNYNPVSTPGGISYSAASVQGLLLNSTVNSSNENKTSHQNKNQLNTPKLLPHDEWSIKLANFFAKYQVDNNSVCIIPRGLTNRSNYCYINAIIQALISCPPFYNLLRTIPAQPTGLRSKSTTPVIDAMIDLAAEFPIMASTPVIRIPRREKGQKREDALPDVNPETPFEPSAIHKMLNGIRTDVFQIEGRQEDAEEFLGCVLNKMNDEMLELMKLIDKKPNVVNGADVNGEDHSDEGSDWQVIYGTRNKGSITRTTDFGRTPISDIFRGQLRSRVQREGDASTDVVQPFFTLQLDIEKAASVKEALEMLVVKDQLEGVTCSKTNQEVAAWKQVTIEELPTILILHLKCFDYKMDGCTKILKTVEFPIELKIDARFLSTKNKYTQKQRQYKLFAVVYHDGKEAIKGHYLTDVFHVGYNSWIRYDDSIVKSVTEHHVLHPRSPRIPYLLYYRRCDTIGPQSTINK